MVWLSFFPIAGFILALGYSLLTRWLLQAWDALPEWDAPEGWTPHTHVSVIVPARNEEQSIGACLQSILQQDYPEDLLECIVVDDHSTDQTAAVARATASSRIRLLSLAEHTDASIPVQSYKKKALEVGIAHAHGQLIVTTDADCRARPAWLRQLVSYYEATGARAIAAPVLFSPVHNALERFQALDFAGMMLVTGAGITQQALYLANGANLAYEKAAFEAAGGFSGNEQFASGDDVFLIQKIASRYPGQIGFVKSRDAVVYTPPQATLRAFFQQRLRWGAKNESYDSWRTTAVIGLVFLYCWAILAAILALPFLPAYGAGLFLALFLAKAVSDYLLLSTAAHFFGRPRLLRGFLRSELMHVAYFALVGVLSLVVKHYEWKGRVVR
ncbi:MAG: glycosyltransferase [Phaeodactylibacter sp.]|nr:glycosyltransferase [Phaeodactylibacter sp.]MCB9275089.1 glycosyltransferase [Lewinellaceae bacterium]